MVSNFKTWSITRKISTTFALFAGIILLVAISFEIFGGLENSEPIKVGEVFITTTDSYQIENGNYQHNHALMVLGYDNDYDSSNNPVFHIGYTSSSIYPNLLNQEMCEVWIYPNQTIELRSMTQTTTFGYVSYSEVGRIHFNNLHWYDSWDETLKYID